MNEMMSLIKVLMLTLKDEESELDKIRGSLNAIASELENIIIYNDKINKATDNVAKIREEIDEP